MAETTLEDLAVILADIHDMLETIRDDLQRQHQEQIEALTAIEAQVAH